MHILKMADVKLLLKEARKLIEEKRYKEAQECCKNILRKDKQNYLGLVLLGKSLDDSDQAPLAFQKAIATKPDHPLAWVGLANYYEQKDDYQSKLKLCPIYDEILKLQIDEGKALECLTKLRQLGISLKSSNAITTFALYIKNNTEGKLYETAKSHFLELIKANVQCEEKDIRTTLCALKIIYDNEPNESFEVLFGKLLLQNRDFKKSIFDVLELQFFSKNVILREMLCKHLCDKFIEANSFFDFEIDLYFEKITMGIENSKYPGLLKSMMYFNKGFYLEAYKQCVPLINYQEANVTEAIFIIKCTIMLKKWSVTQKLATNFLTKAKENVDFVNSLKKIIFLSLVEQRKWKQAVIIIKDFPIEALNINEKANLAKCLIETNDLVDHILEELKTTEFYTQLLAQFLLKQKKYAEIITLLENVDSNTMHFLYMGIAFWELQQYDMCLINLLKAAKIDSENADTFLYLGYYYYYHKDDLSKAKKCFEKAYSLHNTDFNIVKHLSEVYCKLHLVNDDFELLNNAKNSIKMNEWIDFRLGLHYLNRREWDNAIINLRNVIKININNVIAFECLADAYYLRGSYTSALKAYNRVLSLNQKKSPHCLTRIGYIYSLLTQYEDAITTFEEVLKIDSNSLLALKGIVETWMRIAKKKYSAKLYGSARDTAQYAVNYLTEALSIEKKFMCFWNLLAETLMFFTKLPKKYSFVYMKNSHNDFEEGIVKKEGTEIFSQILACYSHIAKQKQQVTSYELASAYLSYYHETNNLRNCQISFNLAVACIQAKPNSWRNWNLLGKICLFLKKYEIAQHCFIKALLVTRKWSVAKIWCNLGTLYIKLNLFKLANYCFWRGQSTMPSYSQSWIGQGLIAEKIREVEAMDLFRHASRLGYHPECALGYADWVCRSLRVDCKSNAELKYVIEGLHAVTYAIDLVEWFSNFEPNNACALTIMGILQERSGLLQTAAKCYKAAYEYAEEDKKNITLLNIGRIQVRLGYYEEAIKTYKAITEASLDSTCGLALALLKKGLYEEAYSAYDTALHWLSNNDNEKADLFVAMAGIVYMYKGADDAKTLLFHSIQVSEKKPTAHSLFAICSLGIIHSDQSLSKLALSELQKYEQEPDFGYDIGFLKSYLACYDDMEQGIKILSDSLHDHPNNANLWFCMAQYCLKSSNNKPKIASGCAQRAIISAHYGGEKCNSPKMLATASIAEHIAGDHMKAMSLAKEGLHMYPCQSDIWAAILLCLLNCKTVLERKSWILTVIMNIRKHLVITRPLGRWITLLEKKIKQL